MPHLRSHGFVLNIEHACTKVSFQYSYRFQSSFTSVSLETPISQLLRPKFILVAHLNRFKTRY